MSTIALSLSRSWNDETLRALIVWLLLLLSSM